MLGWWLYDLTEKTKYTHTPDDRANDDGAAADVQQLTSLANRLEVGFGMQGAGLTCPSLPDLFLQNCGRGPPIPSYFDVKHCQIVVILDDTLRHLKAPSLSLAAPRILGRPAFSSAPSDAGLVRRTGVAGLYTGCSRPRVYRQAITGAC
eukprot:162759-Chlamydomonas_euryale.AAC.4